MANPGPGRARRSFPDRRISKGRPRSVSRYHSASLCRRTPRKKHCTRSAHGVKSPPPPVDRPAAIGPGGARTLVSAAPACHGGPLRHRGARPVAREPVAFPPRAGRRTFLQRRTHRPSMAEELFLAESLGGAFTFALSLPLSLSLPSQASCLTPHVSVPFPFPRRFLPSLPRSPAGRPSRPPPAPWRRRPSSSRPTSRPRSAAPEPRTPSPSTPRPAPSSPSVTVSPASTGSPTCRPGRWLSSPAASAAWPSTLRRTTSVSSSSETIATSWRETPSSGPGPSSTSPSARSSWAASSTASASPSTAEPR